MNWGLDEQLAALAAVARRLVRPAELEEALFVEPLRPLMRQFVSWRDRSGSWPTVPELRYFDGHEALLQVSEAAAQWVAPTFTETLCRAALTQFALDVGDAADGPATEWLELPRKLDQALSAGRILDEPESRQEALQAARKGEIGAGTCAPYGVTGLQHVEPLKTGLRGGEVGAVVATTGVGKSFFLVISGIQALRAELPLFHASLELTRAEVELRHMSALLQADAQTMAAMSDDQFWALTEELLPEAKATFKHYPMRSVGWPLVASEVRRWLDRTGKAGLVVVDYPQLFRGVSEQRHAELKVLYEDIVSLAQSENVPIWIAHQSNRGGLETGDVGLGNFAESYDCTQPIHEIVSLNQTAAERTAKRMRVSFLKRRSAKAGAVAVTYDWSRCQLQEATC